MANRVTDAGRKSTEGHRSIDDFEHWKLQPSVCSLSETTKQPFSNDGEVVRFQGIIKTKEKTGTSFNMFNPAKRGQSTSPAKMSRNLCCCFVLQRILGQIKLFPYQGCCPLQGLFCASKLHVGWEGSQEEACHQGHSHFIPCLPRHVRLQTVPTSSMWQFVSATSTQTQLYHITFTAAWPTVMRFTSSRLTWVKRCTSLQLELGICVILQKESKKPWQHRNPCLSRNKAGFFCPVPTQQIGPPVMSPFFPRIQRLAHG